MAILFLVLVIAIGGAVLLVLSGRRRRAGLLASTLSEDQRAIVAEQVPLTRKLPAELRGRLEGKIALFLDQVDFQGCNGLEVTEEMRLSIAAQACLLIVASDTWYDHLTSVLIYPGAFKSRLKQHSGYVVTEREIVRTGESWSRGPVVLSWSHARQGASDDADGQNVVFHEFAHQIDDLSGRTDGVPVLESVQDLTDWRRTFDAAFQRHVHQVEAGHRTTLNPYGATGPEEFFAVAVEAFFETPTALRHSEPQVHAQLVHLFGLDPETWSDSAEAPRRT